MKDSFHCIVSCQKLCRTPPPLLSFDLCLILGHSSGSRFCFQVPIPSQQFSFSKTYPSLSPSSCYPQCHRQRHLPLHLCVTNSLVSKHKAISYLLPPTGMEEYYTITLQGAWPHRHTNWIISQSIPDNISGLKKHCP